ncbi:hypothetical protein IJI72_00605 [Candidatus Saccharibacteria bacterium]|nr:hypothetical protein [Candidatus Saccharibacteria bacterium]
MKDDNRETQAPNVPSVAKAVDGGRSAGNGDGGKSSGTHSMNVRASDTKKAKGGEADSMLKNVAGKVREAENVLVALSNDPNVDEMAAAIGLSILLESLGKHATAIYSGKTPNVLEFLRPEETFETNTNGLQDFIIELDKEKADHLRYKVDGDFVKVYITPYRTTLSQGDLAFSRGDFNVDLVISLNVAAATELDAALREYGRIMHDATAINVTNGVAGKFGDVEWVEPKASSVSEMVAELAFELKEELDTSVATALLTGIVAATDKFANDATTPEVMMLAAKLMKFGANQQEVFKNISQELEYVEREVAEAEVSSATEELQRETERVGGAGGETMPGLELEPGNVSGEGAEEEVEGEEATEEPVRNDVIVTPEEGQEKVEGESLADQILNKIQNQKRPDYGQMIDQVSAEPMPGEQGATGGVPGVGTGEMAASGMGAGGAIEGGAVAGDARAMVAPSMTMQPNVAMPVDSAQEEAAAMDVIRQANTNPAFPEGMELPTVIPGGGSSVNPASVPAISAPMMSPATDVPQMDLSPLETSQPQAQPETQGRVEQSVQPEPQIQPMGGGLPMPGQELGTPPTPPMPDFSTMPGVPEATTMPGAGASADVPAGAPAVVPGTGMTMGALPGTPSAPSASGGTDPGAFQIPPVAF